MRMLAVVDSIEITTEGSFTVAAATIGGTVLTLSDAADFDEDGGQLDLGGLVLDYDSADMDADTLTLTDALLADVADRTPVYVSPLVQHKTAWVIPVDEVGETTEASPARVLDPALWADTQLAETASGGLSVWVDTDGPEWVLAAIDGPPSYDAANIADETLTLSTAADPDDLAGQNFLATVARAGSAYGLPLDNPVITALNSDGNGMRLDGPGAFLSFSQGNATTAYLSAARMYFSGEADFAQFTALVGRIREALYVEPGAAVQLLSQYQPPEAPTVEVGWPLTVLDLPKFSNPVVAALHFMSGRYYLSGVRNRRGVTQLQMWSYDSDGGDKTLEWEQPLGAFQIKDGIARIGSSWFFAVLPTPDNAVVAVQERDDDGVLVNQWAATTISSETEVCIGRDAAGHVLLQWDDVSTSWDMQTYATTGGAPLSTLSLSPGGGASGFIGSDTYDFGATRIVTGIGNAGDGCWVYTTAGVEQVGDEWTQAFATESADRIAIAAAWNGTDWVELADDGKFVRYTALEKAAGWEVDVDVSAVVTLRDGSGNETNFDAAKVAAFTVNGRQQIVVNAPTVPPGTGMRYCLYLATGASPTRTDFHLFGTPASGDNSWTVEAIPTGTANPPSTNTMPSGTAAIQAGGTDLIRSDGTGYIYDLIAAGGGGGGGIGGVGGGHWGDTYESFGVRGGAW